VIDLYRPTLDEIRGWGDSFDHLMRSSGGRKVFRDFLKCEYSEENILFWLACEELKKESKPEMIEEKARLIYEDYISILSPKEVNFILFINPFSHKLKKTHRLVNSMFIWHPDFMILDL